MKINWQVRIKNPTWWVQVATAIIVPMLAAVGLNWSDITTWGALLDVLNAAVLNPVTLAAVIVSVWNTINDPTTAGLSDSTQALTYEAPKTIAAEDEANRGEL